MDCKEVREHLSEYLDGELDRAPAGSPVASLRQAIDEHLKVCKDCSRELALLRKTVAALRALPKRSLPADVRLQVESRLEHEMLAASTAASRPAVERAPAAPRRPAIHWAYAFAAAASILVIVGIASIVFHTWRPTRVSQPSDLLTMKPVAVPAAPEAAARELDAISPVNRATEADQKHGERVDAVGFTARQSVSAAAEPKTAQPSEGAGYSVGLATPRGAILADEAKALAPQQSLTLSNFIIDPQNAPAELKALLVRNHWPYQTVREGTEYLATLSADQVPLLLTELSNAKTFRLLPQPSKEQILSAPALTKTLAPEAAAVIDRSVVQSAEQTHAFDALQRDKGMREALVTTAEPRLGGALVLATGSASAAAQPAPRIAARIILLNAQAK